MHTKKAVTDSPIHDLLQRRWSPRAFDEKAVPPDLLRSLLEAGRWAPSCFGEEPWRYIVCNRQTHPESYYKLFDCLAEGNKLWVKSVPVLLLTVAKNHFTHNGEPNRWAEYDSGAASENICLQAVALGLIAHQMGGFDPDMAKKAFSIPDGYTCMSVIAVGYQTEPDVLTGELLAREKGPRQRKPLAQLFYQGEWEAGIE
ncbi:malonic semialdehyde reductase [Legionella birminghamensis]|uniref:Malonic semialdehyde reductase n=1 Tax=Legionella birminghamensis TaxID=28083 RepID=A0A378I6P2_9GAMM|nr:nitroreductase family protein [Legionella birminghamensis]KTC70177.1 malonic semialdehyde reductase [Legionella birminghamensis]STX30415.1 malonic semialdehyde reductase [Legionella birminghamensis]